MDDPIWSLSPQAIMTADEVYHQRLGVISIVEYGDGILTAPGEEPRVADREGREIYADSLFDLHRLLEEIRFEIAFATMLTSDYRARHPLEDSSQPAPVVNNMSLSIELLAALAPYAAQPPSPSRLTSALHSDISGNRQLSRWLAAQLLDSAILRCMSNLDRVATMLHIRGGLALEKRADGSPRLPSFDITELKKMRQAYGTHPAWPCLREIATHELYKFIKRYRNGTVHHRRWPSELHGEAQLSYWDAGAPTTEESPPERRYDGLSAVNHIGLTLATWNELVKPAVEAGGRLMTPAS